MTLPLLHSSIKNDPCATRTVQYQWVLHSDLVLAEVLNNCIVPATQSVPHGDAPREYIKEQQFDGDASLECAYRREDAKNIYVQKLIGFKAFFQVPLEHFHQTTQTLMALPSPYQWLIVPLFWPWLMTPHPDRLCKQGCINPAVQWTILRGRKQSKVRSLMIHNNSVSHSAVMSAVYCRTWLCERK